MVKHQPPARGGCTQVTPRLASQHPDMLAGPPWVSAAASLCLHLPACKMGRARTIICLVGAL